ncbi:SecDF P1 head subdomain-containing protein [Actinomadura scrupuli]|uniref:SecDF P1 head subdomain-containing protein n=1 Tax=Actinomadura scrupuli TaxID=559629 RepID=UPI003D981921
MSYPPAPAPYGTPPPPAPHTRTTNRGLVIALVAGAALVILVVAVGVLLVVLGRPDQATSGGPHSVAVRFLSVTGSTPGACTSGGTPSADGSECFRLGDGMTITRVRDIRVVGPDATNPQWRIAMELMPSDAPAFAELTRKASTEAPESPRQRVAIVVGDKVVSAPAVQSAIPGGKIEIQGRFTKQAAERLVQQIIT